MAFASSSLYLAFIIALFGAKVNTLKSYSSFKVAQISVWLFVHSDNKKGPHERGLYTGVSEKLINRII